MIRCQRCGCNDTDKYKYVVLVTFFKYHTVSLCLDCKDVCETYIRSIPEWIGFEEAGAAARHIEARVAAKVVPSTAEIRDAGRALDNAADSIVQALREFIKKGVEEKAMPEIGPMTWEEAEGWEAKREVISRDEMWRKIIIRAIALARQEKKRADRAGDRIGHADHLAQEAEALLSGLKQAWKHEKPLVSIAFAHGVEYKGPDLSPSVQAVKEALRAYRGTD